MRRILFLSTFLWVPGLAPAADFPLIAPVTEAEIYLQGATLIRTGALDLPAGEHRLLLPHAGGDSPDITLTGATLGAVERLPGAVADGRRFLTDEQATALTAYEDALEVEQQADDARLRAEAMVRAAEDQLAFLRSVDAGNLAALNPEALLATLDLVGTRVTQAETDRADARTALRAAERTLRDAGLLRAQAKLDLDATGAQLGQRSLMAVGVTLAEAGPVGLRIESFEPQASWHTAYDVTLGADDVVTLDRKVEIRGGGIPLRDVTLRLSTADPFAPTAPRDVLPDQAQLRETGGPSVQASQHRTTDGIRVEDTTEDFPLNLYSPAAAVANFDGPVVTYDYPVPVTLPATGSVTRALDTRTLDARLFNRAAPRTDTTAFLMAEVTNSTGEPLLPGPATLYRAGIRIGAVRLPLMPAGDEVELAFGPQEHLRLEFVRRDNAEGDRGLFFTSGTRTQNMVFRVRNLSDAVETVETRFALPFSEEEDLEVRVTPDPAPDARNVEDRRGVAQWDLVVAGGAERQVEIDVTLTWPEGETLIWQP